MEPRYLRVLRHAPIVMSLLAISLVVESGLAHGDRQPIDEGWQAHLFQLLMVAEIPLIACHAVISRRDLKRMLAVLLLQLLVWGGALALLWSLAL